MMDVRGSKYSWKRGGGQDLAAGLFEYFTSVGHALQRESIFSLIELLAYPSFVFNLIDGTKNLLYMYIIQFEYSL